MCLSSDKIRDPRTPAVLFELIPPPVGLSADDYKVYAECVIDVILNAKVTVNAINIPEIREEQREGARTYTYSLKSDPRQLGTTIKQVCNGQLNVVVNRCTVYDELPTQIQWLDETFNYYRLQHIILVGADSSRFKHPGPSVTELAYYIGKTYSQQFMCGGIAMPTRRNAIAELDEPSRMLNKIKAGIEYFTSQIIYDAASVKQLLLDYHQLCQQENIEPRRLILSFAPISSQKDMQFMQWLGVSIPTHIQDDLFKSSIAIGWRSLQHSVNTLHEICRFMLDNKIKVPLGINVEHINTPNFMLSKQFIDELGGVYMNYINELTQVS